MFQMLEFADGPQQPHRACYRETPKLLAAIEKAAADSDPTASTWPPTPMQGLGRQLVARAGWPAAFQAGGPCNAGDTPNGLCSRSLARRYSSSPTRLFCWPFPPPCGNAWARGPSLPPARPCQSEKEPSPHPRARLDEGALRTLRQMRSWAAPR